MTSIDAAMHDLCDWAAACRWVDVPGPIRRRGLMVLADDLAAMIAGADEPELHRYRETLLRRDETAEATLIAPALPRVGRMGAAAHNGLAGNWAELDEGFRPVTCHAGVYILPALLAEAEVRGESLSAVLRALVLAYDIAARVALAYRFPSPRVHAHAGFGSLAAAAAIALLRGADGAGLLSAVGAGATLAHIGPRGHLVEGILIRNGWAPAGGVAGMLAADWAEAGVGGAASSVAGVYGEILGGAGALGELTAGLGQEWMIARGYHKLYACCQHGHPSVEAALMLRAEEGVAAEDIAEILVASHPLACSLPNANPTTTLGAKFSMPHMVAAPFVYGTGGAEAFTAAALANPAVARLRRLVRIEPYAPLPPPPHDRPARVTVTLRDGRCLSRECLSARGNPDRPLDDAALADKVAGLSAPVLPGLVRLLGAMPDTAAFARPWAELLRDLART